MGFAQSCQHRAMALDGRKEDLAYLVRIETLLPVEPGRTVGPSCEHVLNVPMHPQPFIVK